MARGLHRVMMEPSLLAKIGVWATAVTELVWAALLFSSSERVGDGPSLTDPWVMVGAVVLFGPPLVLAAGSAWMTWKWERIEHVIWPAAFLAIYAVVFSLLGTAAFLLPATVLGFAGVLARRRRAS